MPCPFGFTAEGDGDAADAETSEQEEEEQEESGSDGDASDPDVKEEEEELVVVEKPAKRERKKPVQAEPEDFDYDKDPVKWFYSNQIKSEREFQKKKDLMRTEARKRLDDIMASKGKLLELDSDVDSFSIRSSELSDLNSDVDSLGSIMSCADSWILDARYPAPAGSALKWAAGAALVVLSYCMYVSIQAAVLTRELTGVVVNGWWPAGSAAACSLQGLLLLVLILSAAYRSRRMLLAGQAGLLVTYSAFLVLVCAIILDPTAVDPTVQDTACMRLRKTDVGSKLCKLLPGFTEQLQGHMRSLMWVNSTAAVLCLASLGAGVWFIFELAYIEKKAIKHKRRHKRRKHSIPWHKIKIVGPVTNCGATAPAVKHTGGGGDVGGKCPFAQGGAAAAGADAGQAASKCPFAGLAAGGGSDKKDN